MFYESFSIGQIDVISSGITNLSITLFTEPIPNGLVRFSGLMLSIYDMGVILLKNEF